MSGLSSAFPQPARIAATAPDALSMLGGSFAMVAASGAAQTLLAAATNVNGAVLRWGMVSSVGAATALFVATTAPTGLHDVTRRRLLIAQSLPLATFFSPLDIPAGLGIFAFSSAAAADSLIGAGWDLK
jgi:hypothetical protein